MSAAESTVHGDTGYGPVVWRVVRGEPFRRCSYCGSLHPEDFLAAAKAGGRVDRTVDWKYGWPHKVYIDVPADPKLICVHQTSTHPTGSSRPWTDLTRAERKAVERDGYDKGDGYFLLGPRESHFGKFYNVHQAEPWVTEELRQAIGYHTGYVITDAGGGKIRWQAFDDAALEATDA